ncbi:Txe/YoeB family addiction module toxin [Bacteroidales bacterium OttesenSCG-928-B11]|nr:Txe/YoeB family addiction module toxin [Bacteroidales bacterium OttesenSCG-928-B11]
MTYDLEFTDFAIEDIRRLKIDDRKAYEKLQRLLLELMDHPKTGTGKPKMLRHNYSGCYSRRVSQKHRLVYRIEEERITVLVLSVSGHYDDK